MRDDYQDRFSEQRRDHGSRHAQDRQHHSSRDEQYTPRQDYSRSPHRQDEHGGGAADSSRQPMDAQRGRAQDEYRYDEPDGRQGGRDGDPRRGGRRQYDDYCPSMYDEPSRESEPRDRYRDERRSPRGRSYRDGDWSRRRSRSPGRHARSRSRSPAKDAGKPTDTVILEGLPFCISSTELHDSLLDSSIASEFRSIDVRISSTKGNRRAFVQFEHVDQAMAFVKEHYPKILIYLQQSTDEVPDGQFDAYVHYARNRDEGDARGNAGDWVCPQCDFSNFATRSKCRSCGSYPSGVHWQQSLTGAADAADVASQIVVIYPLPAFADEDMLAREMKRLEIEKPDPAKDTGAAAGPKLKSTAPTSTGAGFGAKPGSLHRVFLMRDAQSDESFKYGFAEFWTLEDAAAAVKKVQMARAFLIAGTPVTVSTIHMGVFLPEERELTPLIERRSFHPLFNPALRVRYRDHHVYPSQQIVTGEPPGGLAALEASAAEEADDKKSKKRKADGNPTSSASATKKPIAMAGKMAMWQRKHGELHGDSEAGTDGDKPADPDAPPFKLSSANAPIKIALSSTTKLADAPASASPPEPAAAVSYVDRDRLMCLICMRKYKSTDEVDIHEKSRNHKTATEDEGLVKAALPRLAARDKRLAASASAAPQYRDRAKERRQVYSQPSKPSGAPSASTTSSTSGSAPPQQSAAAAAAAPEPKSEPKASKGAGMLAKMGWSAGQGLGADGSGRTAAIETQAYQQGVGLGAEGGNLGDAAEVAERQTKGGYRGYLDSVQDKARERYNKMG